MPVAGRRKEIEEVHRLLDRACHDRRGGLLVIAGPAGSGKTLLAETAAAGARERGLQVLWARPATGQPGRLAWASLLRDTGAPAKIMADLLADDAGPLVLDAAAAHLVAWTPRLIVIDDIDRGGPDATEMLSVAAARCSTAPVALLATATSPLGITPELRLGPLSESDLSTVLADAKEAREGKPDTQASHALWLASRGVPGVALHLAREVAGDDSDDPVVHLALSLTASTVFLNVDTNLVRLLEIAAERAHDDATRGRVLAKLARELLGDASAGARRRQLADEALRLARRAADAGDPTALAEVLDARLHALWDQHGAEDRLAAGSEIIDLARAAGDGERERHGIFWRFVALMELGRIAEAESALAVFAHETAAAGDAEAAVMVKARHAMLAILRGNFAEADRLAREVAQEGERIGLPDAQEITGSLRGPIALETRLTDMERHAVPPMLLANARDRPGHLLEATAARVLATIGRTDEATVELDRVLPRALASSGPRWLGAMADLAFVAAATGNAAAAALIYDALLPYAERLVTFGGAASTWGPVTHYLGLSAATMGRSGDAVRHFEEAIKFEERSGALPYLAHSLAGLADALTREGDARRAAECLSRSREIARRLDMAVLLDRLGAPASEWSLLRDGADWLLTAGDEHARIRDGRGLHYLRALLAAPGQDIRALDLVAGGAGLVTAGTGPVLDHAAQVAYQRRLAQVAEAIESADRAGDQVAAHRAEAERAALLRELRKSTGLGGRDREGSPEAERARVNVTRTLRAAIDRIAGQAPAAAAHLSASVRTGANCRYDPSPGGPDRWLV